MDNLFEVKEELVTVKKTIDRNGAYLSLTGEPLRQYFGQLREKEKYLESISVDNLRTTVTTTSERSGHSERAAVTLVPRELPSGPPDQFDRSNLEAVCSHMSKYEASAGESAKTLRALATLAYANPKGTGELPEVIPQLLRLLAFHPTENFVQLYGMKALNNMAFDESLALKSPLSSKEALGAMIDAMSGTTTDSVETKHKGSAAIGLLVKAETAANGNAVPETGPTQALFTCVRGDARDHSRRVAIGELVKQLLENEVTSLDFLASRFVGSARVCEASSVEAKHWLELASVFVKKEIYYDGSLFMTKLMEQDVITVAQRVISRNVADAPTQFAGMDAMGNLVGHSWSALEIFAKVNGVELIEAAMKQHPHDAALQARGIRCLAGGAIWPKDMKDRAGYSLERAVKLTKVAMSNHREVVELHVAAINAVYKYLVHAEDEKEGLAEELRADGGFELVTSSLELLSKADSSDSDAGIGVPLDVRTSLASYLAKA